MFGTQWVVCSPLAHGVHAKRSGHKWPREPARCSGQEGDGGPKSSFVGIIVTMVAIRDPTRKKSLLLHGILKVAGRLSGETVAELRHDRTRRYQSDRLPNVMMADANASVSFGDERRR
jgi:hypothetical protein